jgi:hypothetical protein
MRILVYGAGKSGTTVLYECVKWSAESHFGVPFRTLFEPKDGEAIDAFLENRAPGIAKMLIERLVRCADRSFLGRFDKCLIIIRDPRDNIVSRLVWTIATRLHEADVPLRERIVEAICSKQANPDHISLLALFELAQPLLRQRKWQKRGRTDTLAAGDFAKGVRRYAYLPVDVLTAEHPFATIHYEDFVDGRTSALAAYLGFPILSDFVVDPKHRRLRRTGTHGYWRNWFLPEDYAYFVSERRAALALLGYEDSGPFAGPKTISREESIDYIRGLAGRDAAGSSRAAV